MEVLPDFQKLCKDQSLISALQHDAVSQQQSDQIFTVFNDQMKKHLNLILKMLAGFNIKLFNEQLQKLTNSQVKFFNTLNEQTLSNIEQITLFQIFVNKINLSYKEQNKQHIQELQELVLNKFFQIQQNLTTFEQKIQFEKTILLFDQHVMHDAYIQKKCNVLLYLNYILITIQENPENQLITQLINDENIFVQQQELIMMTSPYLKMYKCYYNNQTQQTINVDEIQQLISDQVLTTIQLSQLTNTTDSCALILYTLFLICNKTQNYEIFLQIIQNQDLIFVKLEQLLFCIQIVYCKFVINIDENSQKQILVEKMLRYCTKHFCCKKFCTRKSCEKILQIEDDNFDTLLTNEKNKVEQLKEDCSQDNILSTKLLRQPQQQLEYCINQITINLLYQNLNCIKNQTDLIITNDILQHIQQLFKYSNEFTQEFQFLVTYHTLSICQSVKCRNQDNEILSDSMKQLDMEMQQMTVKYLLENQNSQTFEEKIEIPSNIQTINRQVQINMVLYEYMLQTDYKSFFNFHIGCLTLIFSLIKMKQGMTDEDILQLDYSTIKQFLLSQNELQDGNNVYHTQFCEIISSIYNIDKNSENKIVIKDYQHFYHSMLEICASDTVQKCFKQFFINIFISYIRDIQTQEQLLAIVELLISDQFYITVQKIIVQTYDINDYLIESFTKLIKIQIICTQAILNNKFQFYTNLLHGNSQQSDDQQKETQEIEENSHNSELKVTPLSNYKSPPKLHEMQEVYTISSSVPRLKPLIKKQFQQQQSGAICNTARRFHGFNIYSLFHLLLGIQNQQVFSSILTNLKDIINFCNQQDLINNNLPEMLQIILQFYELNKYNANNEYIEFVNCLFINQTAQMQFNWELQHKIIVTLIDIHINIATKKLSGNNIEYLDQTQLLYTYQICIQNTNYKETIIRVLSFMQKNITILTQNTLLKLIYQTFLYYFTLDSSVYLSKQLHIDEVNDLFYKYFIQYLDTFKQNANNPEVEQFFTLVEDFVNILQISSDNVELEQQKLQFIQYIYKNMIKIIDFSYSDRSQTLILDNYFRTICRQIDQCDQNSKDFFVNEITNCLKECVHNALYKEAINNSTQINQYLDQIVKLYESKVKYRETSDLYNFIFQLMIISEDKKHIDKVIQFIANEVQLFSDRLKMFLLAILKFENFDMFKYAIQKIDIIEYKMENQIYLQVFKNINKQMKLINIQGFLIHYLDSQLCSSNYQNVFDLCKLLYDTKYHADSDNVILFIIIFIHNINYKSNFQQSTAYFENNLDIFKKLIKYCLIFTVTNKNDCQIESYFDLVDVTNIDHLLIQKDIKCIHTQLHINSFIIKISNYYLNQNLLNEFNGEYQFKVCVFKETYILLCKYIIQQCQNNSVYQIEPFNVFIKQFLEFSNDQNKLILDQDIYIISIQLFYHCPEIKDFMKNYMQSIQMLIFQEQVKEQDSSDMRQFNIDDEL